MKGSNAKPPVQVLVFLLNVSIRNLSYLMDKQDKACVSKRYGAR